MAAPKLGLAVEHIVRNAAEYNDTATPRVDISAQTPETDAGVVKLPDEGPGIPADVVQSVDSSSVGATVFVSCHASQASANTACSAS